MSLVKRTYVDGETVITAENLNDIQDAIIENEEAIEDQGEAIEGKYTKPSGGIPASDMASGVQTSLGKADTAYQKPSGGIPSTDLASAVQTSLGKADSALQSSDIDNTLTVAGKAADAKKTGDEISDVKNTLSHKADVIYDTASGDIASFPDGADGLPVKDLTIAIEPVQSGTGDPSPTNVRPISGWTGANVTRTGKNLTSITSGINQTLCEVKEGVTYTVAWDESEYAGYNINLIKNGVESRIPNENVIRKEADFFTFLAPYDCLVQVNNWAAKNQHDYRVYVGNYQTKPDYVPYHGTAIPISWQSSAGTVYGGTLDVTSGVLTVDRAYVEYDGSNDEPWNYEVAAGGKNAYIKITDAKIGQYGSSSLLRCNEGKINPSASAYAGTCFISGTGNFNYTYLDALDISSAVGFKTWLSSHPMQVLYELVTPQTYQLTPTEVTTLLGQNNVWADTGAVLNCEYPADTKLYIDKKLAALVAALS